MSLDVREIAKAKATEDDGGVDMGTESRNSRVHIGESETYMSHGKQSIRMDHSGVKLSGARLDIDVPLDGILFNGMFRMNPSLMLGIPSTVATPIPVLQPSLGAAAKPLVESLSALRSFFVGDE